MVTFLDRLDGYDEAHCWQYDIRLKNAQTDLREALNYGFTEEELSALRIKDFTFSVATSKHEKDELTRFIKKHEWLGNLSQYTTHWFQARYKGYLAGVILMNQPNAFSKMLGEGTEHLERLVSRGACISWSPKNLASAFLMWSINYMSKNTKYRLFTAYSDPTAKELGTIYQACNWFYLGQTAGGTKKYISPYTGKLVSDRAFRQKTYYKKYADELGIDFRKNWVTSTGMNWENVPNDIEKLLRDKSKERQEASDFIELPLKHKYAYVQGANKGETKQLKKLFLSRNKIKEYPKDRGYERKIMDKPKTKPTQNPQLDVWDEFPTELKEPEPPKAPPPPKPDSEITLNENWLSPVEEYDGVWYKRDDLFEPFGDGLNGGKVRQAIALFRNNLELYRKNGVITATTGASPQGLIIARVAKYFGVKCYIGVGGIKDLDWLMKKNRFLPAAEKLGAKVVKISNAYYTSPINFGTKNFAEEHGLELIKFGISEDNIETIMDVIADQVKNIPDVENLIVPVGSGLNFAGLIKGLVKYNKTPKVTGILSGANSVKAIEGYLKDVDYEYTLHKSDVKYNDKMIIDKPFQIDPVYEAKTVKWFRENPLPDALIWIVGNQRNMKG